MIKRKDKTVLGVIGVILAIIGTISTISLSAMNQQNILGFILSGLAVIVGIILLAIAVSE